MAGSRAFTTFPAITLLIFELQTSRSEHPNRNAEIYQHQMAGSRAFSTFPAITRLIFELQTSHSEHPNRNAEIYQMAGSRAFSSFSDVRIIFLTSVLSFLAFVVFPSSVSSWHCKTE